MINAATCAVGHGSKFAVANTIDKEWERRRYAAGGEIVIEDRTGVKGAARVFYRRAIQLRGLLANYY